MMVLAGLRQIFYARRSTELGDILRLQALIGLSYRKLNGFTFLETAKSLSLNCTVMHKDISLPIRSFQKTISLAGVKPFHLPFDTI